MLLAILLISSTMVFASGSKEASSSSNESEGTTIHFRYWADNT